MKITGLIISLLILIYSSNLNAQDKEPKTAIGIRLGGLTSGFTFRSHLKNDAAFEGILSFAHRTFLITALYEKFKPIESAEGLKWFYGAGAHLGFFNNGGRYLVYKNRGTHVYYFDDGNANLVPGIDFIIGLDYKFKNAPLSLSLDLKPFFDFFDGTQFYFDGALSFRFVF